MTVKQKFDRIDQSKLGQAQVDILKMMAQKTDNFKTKDKATLDKIDASLDKIISALQEKNPDALKSTARKTSTAKSATKGSKGGKTAMQLAKDIRKPNESWNEAVKRAGAIMRGDAKQASKTVTSELQKLKAFVNRRKQLKSISGTDLLRDSKRKAMPKGKRKSKEGNVYYEYRENRTDRLAPNYPKNAPLLAGGGGVDASMEYDLAGNTSGGTGGLNADMPLSDFSGTNYTDLVGETGAMSAGEMFAKGGGVGSRYVIRFEDSKGNKEYMTTDAYNKAEAMKVGKFFEGKYQFKGFKAVSVSEIEDNYARGGSTDHKYLNRSEDYEVRYAKGKNRRGYGNLGFANGGATDHKYLNHSEDYEVRYAKGKNRRGYGNLKYELGGATMSNQQVIADASQQYVNYYLGEGANQGMYKDGGAIKNQYAGRTSEDIWNSLTSVQKKHFLIDHFIKVEDEEQVEYSDLDEEQKEFVDQYSKSNWKNLDWVKIPFKKHVKLGQYATGGMMPMVSTRKHRND
jgi:hypothetical protein